MATGKRYLEGNLAPVREEVTATELTVTGTIPAHLDGRYLRNGPNPVVDPDPATYHWFTGTGMVHGLRLRDGKAEWYRNRWVRSAEVAEALGEEPHPGPVHADMDFAANTHVVGLAGRTYALVEAGSRPYELTEELETVGPTDFGGTLPGGLSAHTKTDPVTGELHAVAYFWGWANRVQYVVVGADGRVRRTVDIEVGGPTMVHDLSLTANYVVIYDQPVTFDMEKAMAGGRLPYSWNPEYPARVGLMSRDGDGSEVDWFDVEQCYVYHPLNAYEDGDQVVLDVVRHPRTFATDLHGPNEGPPTLDRWTLDRVAHKAVEERLDDQGQEFPRFDERLTGRRHRFGYSVGFGPGPDGTLNFGGQALLKHDLASGTAQARPFPAEQAVSEFVFVPNGPEAAEDDGVVMGFVYDKTTNRSELLLLDAGTLEDVAAIHLPARVPQGFHGNWVPSANG